MLLVITDNIESDATSGRSLAYVKVSEKTYALNVFLYLDIFFLHPSHQSMEATHHTHILKNSNSTRKIIWLKTWKLFKSLLCVTNFRYKLRKKANSIWQSINQDSATYSLGKYSILWVQMNFLTHFICLVLSPMRTWARATKLAQLCVRRLWGIRQGCGGKRCKVILLYIEVFLIR